MQTDLPAQRPCFGREGLIDVLVESVTADDPQPILLLGGPGIGKTTVAVETLCDSRVAQRFGDRRYYVSCTRETSRGGIAAKIALALGVGKSPFPEDVVSATLERDPTLLVIDDVEVLYHTGHEEVESLLMALSSLQAVALVLVFRGMESDQRFRWAQPIRVQPFAPSEACEAFLQAGGTRHMHDSLIPSLLESVGYVPYAVVLLGKLSQNEANLDSLCRRWETERAKLLEMAMLPQGFEKMAASFELSIASPEMDDAAKRLLSLMATLPEGVDHADLQELLPGVGESAGDTLCRVGLAFPRAARLRIHSLLREHVAQNRPPHRDDELRSVEFYLQLAMDQTSRFSGEESDEAVLRFAANLGNIEAAIEATFGSAFYQRGLGAAAALAAFLYLTGAGSRDLIRRAEKWQGSMAPNSRANFVRNCADLEMRQRSHKKARQMYEKARDLFKRSSDYVGVADCIKKIADLAREDGRLTEAAKQYEAARQIQQHKDLICEAGCLAGLADIAVARHEYFDARSDFQLAFQLSLEAGNHAGMAYCRMRMGYIAWDQEQYEEARSDFQDGVRYASQAHHLLIEASALQGLAAAELRLSNIDRAEEPFQNALVFFRKVDDTFGIGGCLRGLAEVACRRLDYARARHLYRQALEIYQRGPHWPDIQDICRRLMELASDDEERQFYEEQLEDANASANASVSRK